MVDDATDCKRAITLPAVFAVTELEIDVAGLGEILMCLAYRSFVLKGCYVGST